MTLKEYLASTGLRQDWLAAQVGVSNSAMSLYVNRRRIPRPETQLRFQEITKGKVRMGRDWTNGKSRGEKS